MTRTFHMTRRVQFAETDLAGVLHFANYFRMMEEAECAFWRSLGLSVVVEDGDVSVSWPRVKTGCEYFASAKFEDELDLSLVVAELGDKSITFEVTMQCDGRRIAAGRTTAVCCQTVDGVFRSVAIPEKIREKLTDFVEHGSSKK